jgi:hypothetical protein
MADTLEQLLGQLKDDNPRLRVEACKKLQDLGDPQAIIELSNLYKQEDETPKVKAAAEKALRHFAAQESGQKAGGGGLAKLMRSLASLLSLSLVLLILANAVLRLTATTLPEPSDKVALLSTYQEANLKPALTNLDLLQQEWNAGAGNLPCAVRDQLQTLPDVTAQPIDLYTYPDLNFVGALQEATLRLRNVRRLWEVACRENGSKGTQEDFIEAQADLRIAGELLTQVLGGLISATTSPLPTNAPPADKQIPSTLVPSVTPGPSPTPTNTRIPTNTPLPTLNPALVSGLERTISNTQAALSSLKADRLEVVRNGEPSQFGCSANTVDPDFTGVAPELLAREPDLGGAIGLLNQALALARTATDFYTATCEAQNFTLANVDAAIAQVDEALTLLELVQGIVDQYKAR